MSARRRTSSVGELDGFERSSGPRLIGATGVASPPPEQPLEREAAPRVSRAARARADRVEEPLAGSLVSSPAGHYAALARLGSTRSNPTTDRAHFLETR